MPEIGGKCSATSTRCATRECKHSVNKCMFGKVANAVRNNAVGLWSDSSVRRLCIQSSSASLTANFWLDLFRFTFNTHFLTKLERKWTSCQNRCWLQELNCNICSPHRWFHKRAWEKCIEPSAQLSRGSPTSSSPPPTWSSLMWGKARLALTSDLLNKGGLIARSSRPAVWTEGEKSKWEF